MRTCSRTVGTLRIFGPTLRASREPNEVWKGFVCAAAVEEF